MHQHVVEKDGNALLRRVVDVRPGETAALFLSAACFSLRDTDGTGSGAALVARWTYQDGQVVDESTHPAGKYKVEILLNGQSVQRKDFEVK